MNFETHFYGVLNMAVLVLCVWIFGYCMMRSVGWHGHYKRCTLWPLKAFLVNPVKSVVKKNKKFLFGLAAGVIVAFWLMTLYNQTQQ